MKKTSITQRQNPDGLTDRHSSFNRISDTTNILFTELLFSLKNVLGNRIILIQ